jgi:hypothetical protein
MSLFATPWGCLRLPLLIGVLFKVGATSWLARAPSQQHFASLLNSHLASIGNQPVSQVCNGRRQRVMKIRNLNARCLFQANALIEPTSAERAVYSLLSDYVYLEARWLLLGSMNLHRRFQGTSPARLNPSIRTPASQCDNQRDHVTAFEPQNPPKLSRVEPLHRTSIEPSG